MGPLLVIGFLLVPVAEIYVIIQVGQVIGPFPTLALLIFESLLGAWLVKREGRAAWSLQKALSSGRLPGTELLDAALVLVGGTLLLAPGFLTDVVGFFFIAAPSRPVARRLLLWLVMRRAARVAARHAAWGGPRPTRQAGGRRSGSQHPGGPPRQRRDRRPDAAAARTATGGRPRVIPGELVTGPDADGGPTDRASGQDNGPDSKGPGRAAGG